jgi:hypothetical protein
VVHTLACIYGKQQNLFNFLVLGAPSRVSGADGGEEKEAIFELTKAIYALYKYLGVFLECMVIEYVFMNLISFSNNFDPH